MARWRTMAIFVLAAFGLLVAVSATRTWTDTKPLVAPPDVKQQVPDTVKYECGAPWGGARVHGPASTPRPVMGTPCGQRDERRRLSFVDVVLALAGIGYLALGPRSTHEPAPIDAATA